MALCEMHYWSAALGKQTGAVAIVPQNAPGPVPVLYLLHGLSDDQTMWTRRTSIERYVDGLPLMVVMPDGGRGFYTDARSHVSGAYEAAIVRDLIPFIDAAFQTRPNRAGRAIAGLSMGGYGAMKLALKHPGLFAAAVSHSGAVAFGSRPIPAERADRAEWVNVFGEDPTSGPDDAFALAQKCPPAQRPALRIDCGTGDFLVEDNRAFHAHLDKIGYPHEYAEHAGGHDWAYWDAHIQDTLAFAGRVLGVQRPV